MSRRRKETVLIPTRAWTLRLIKNKGMPLHIMSHSMMVRRVAVIIGHSIRLSGYEINLPLIDRAALLHDICKIDSIVSGGDHAMMGEELLKDLGYPLVGDIIGQHVRLKSMVLNEPMIVNYADKRVMHEHVVSLSKRFFDLMNRYGSSATRQERILGLFDKSREIEGIILKSSGLDTQWLENLNLIPGDYPLYGGDGILGKNGPVEV